MTDFGFGDMIDNWRLGKGKVGGTNTSSDGIRGSLLPLNPGKPRAPDDYAPFKSVECKDQPGGLLFQMDVPGRTPQHNVSFEDAEPNEVMECLSCMFGCLSCYQAGQLPCSPKGSQSSSMNYSGAARVTINQSTGKIPQVTIDRYARGVPGSKSNPDCIEDVETLSFNSDQVHKVMVKSHSKSSAGSSNTRPAYPYADQCCPRTSCCKCCFTEETESDKIFLQTNVDFFLKDGSYESIKWILEGTGKGSDADLQYNVHSSLQDACTDSKSSARTLANVIHFLNGGSK